MNKFTKISATALFAIFLTACDKPAEKKAEAPAAQPETTQTAKVEEKKEEQAPAAETPKAEQAPAAEAPKAQEADAQGVEDFNKLVAWNAEQEKEMATLQAELQQKIATQDKAQIESAFTQFTAKVSDVIKSLDAVEIKNAEVQKLKDKLKESLSLSSEVLSGAVKAMVSGRVQTARYAEEEARGEFVFALLRRRHVVAHVSGNPRVPLAGVLHVGRLPAAALLPLRQTFPFRRLPLYAMRQNDRCPERAQRADTGDARTPRTRRGADPRRH